MKVLRTCAKCGALTLAMQRTKTSDVDVTLTGHFFSSDPLHWKDQEVRFSGARTAYKRYEVGYAVEDNGNTRHEIASFPIPHATLSDLVRKSDLQIEVCPRDAPTETSRMVNPEGCDTFPVLKNQRKQIVRFLNR